MEVEAENFGEGLQCLSAFRASLPDRRRARLYSRYIPVSNAFRHSGHHCQGDRCGKAYGLVPKVSNAFRHSGHHCHHGTTPSVGCFIIRSPMPFGIQGITATTDGQKYLDAVKRGLQCLSAFRASLPAVAFWQTDVFPHGGSPMPFGIQGITAGRPAFEWLVITTGSPMPFGIQGITALRSGWSEKITDLKSLQCLSAFRASLPPAGCGKSHLVTLMSPMPFGIQGITAIR